MAVDTYSISGAALIYVNTGVYAAPGDYVLLGYTEAGVDMVITEAKTEIMTDLMGDKVPQDYQDMGMSATITTPLIAYDSAVLASMINRGNRIEWGNTNMPGSPVGQFGYAFSTLITTPLGVGWPAIAEESGSPPIVGTPAVENAAPWTFISCIVRTESHRLATKANPFRLEIYAWPWLPYTATSGWNAPLFTRSIV